MFWGFRGFGVFRGLGVKGFRAAGLGFGIFRVWV